MANVRGLPWFAVALLIASRPLPSLGAPAGYERELQLPGEAKQGGGNDTCRNCDYTPLRAGCQAVCSWRATQAKTVAIASAISPPSALVPGPWRITDLGAAGAKVEMHKKCNRAFTDNPIVGFYLADRDKDMYQTIEEVREVRRAATFKEFELLIDIGSQFAQQRDPGARHGLEGVKRLIEEANGPNDYVFAHSMKSFPEAFNAASRGSSAKAVALKGPSAAWGMLADGALTSGASLQGAMHVILPNGSCSPTALQENPQLIVSGIVFISREAFLLAGQLAVGVSHPGAGQFAASLLELGERFLGLGYDVTCSEPNSHRYRQVTSVGDISGRDGNDRSSPQEMSEALLPETSYDAITGPMAPGRPLVSLVMQYFSRPARFPEIVKRVEAACAALKVKGRPCELLVNNDSRGDLQIMTPFLLSIGGLFSVSPDIHEVRGFNMMARMSTGKFLCLLQDDDYPPPTDWLLRAVQLFNKVPSMGLLMGLQANVGPDKYGSAMTGKKYPPPVATVAGSRFMYAEQGIQAPFFFPRWLFLHLGQYPLDFSCPGLPGVGFDMEMGYRMWSSNLTVGLYEPHFQHRVDKLGGTKSNPVQLKARNEATWVNLRIIEQAYRAQGVCLYNRLCKKGSDSVFVRKINALNKKLRGDKGQGGHPNPSASHRKHRRPNESAEDMISTFGDDRDEVADTLPSWAAGHTAYITQVLAGVTLGLAAIEGLLTVSVGKSLFVKLRRRSQRHIKR